jgi:hypothetical protein
MANAITILSKLKTQSKLIVTGTIALSGSYTQYSGGGEVLDFTKATLPLGTTLPNSTGPNYFSAFGSSGYGYGTPASLPQSVNPLQVPLKVTTASNTELSAGAYPAGVTGDNIQFEAHFPALL